MQFAIILLISSVYVLAENGQFTNGESFEMTDNATNWTVTITNTYWRQRFLRGFTTVGYYVHNVPIAIRRERTLLDYESKKATIERMVKQILMSWLALVNSSHVYRSHDPYNTDTISIYYDEGGCTKNSYGFVQSIAPQRMIFTNRKIWLMNDDRNFLNGPDLRYALIRNIGRALGIGKY